MFTDTDVKLNSWDVFDWDSVSRSFIGDTRKFSGFTEEYYDGEARGFGVRGRSGEVLWFHIVAEVLMDNDVVDYWIVKPSCSKGAALITQGTIYNY